MPFSTRPPYLYLGGSMMMHAPFEQQNSQMFGFFLKGDLQKLQRLCDRQLNSVARGKYRFEPLTNYVMLTFTKINKDYSLHPSDRVKGWGAEIDTSIWVPVGQYQIENGKKKLLKIHWIMPYIWVDHPMTVINGREIFGYPKYMGQFQMPTSPANADYFSLEVNAFKTYSPDTQSAMGMVLEVKKSDGASANDQKKEWGTWADFAKGVAGGMMKFTDFVLTDRQIDEQILQGLLQPQLPQLFLKQFPDGSGQNAVYQALTTSPAVINGFHGAGLLLHEYTCTLHEFASEPIADDLGLVIGDQTAAMSFWINFDFSIQPPEELVNNSVVEKKKIAVLGGGVSAMTSVYAITSQPDWQRCYDITVYQMGWRLGGKGASGRNAAMGQRIEEHGLHIWFGFYENAFRVMQDCYAELNRPIGAPLRTWDEAFRPQSFVVVEEFIKGIWETWPFEFPVKPGDPGDGEESPSLWNIIETIYAWLLQAFEQLISLSTTFDPQKPQHAAFNRAKPSPQGFGAILGRLTQTVMHPVEALQHEGLTLLSHLSALTRQCGERPSHSDAGLCLDALREIKRWIDHWVTDFLEDHTELRRLYICMDLALVSLIGMFEDQVLLRGFSAINDIDFMAWLKKHGANPQITVASAPVRALYDLVFAYEDGDVTRPNLEAGTCLSGAMRILFCYKGGLMWKMQAGMGDVVFTPLYEVLKRRGVKFEYFHKLEEVIPDAVTQDRIASLRLTRQVTLNDGDYSPLVDVKGLACWPSQPLYDQIDPVQAQLLQENSINLESHWSDWPAIYQQHFGKPLEAIHLQAGVDFDLVIYGLSVASLPVNCARLLPLSSPLRETSARVKSVVTQAYQLWLTQDLRTLGWQPLPESGEEPVLTSFTEPFDTWASMDQLLCREDWDATGDIPKNLAYFCSVQAISEFPPATDHEFPARCAASVKTAAIAHMNSQMQWLWPNAQTNAGFHWDWLLDPQQQTGPRRFDAQYWRSNIDPSERYVLSVADSTRYRVATDGTGFSNFFVTGDWIKNGINAGCVEGAVQAGLQTSRAICGFPKIIKGEKDFA